MFTNVYVCVCLCLFEDAWLLGWCLQTQLFVNMFVFVFVYIPEFVNTPHWCPRASAMRAACGAGRIGVWQHAMGVPSSSVCRSRVGGKLIYSYIAFRALLGWWVGGINKYS